MVQGTYTWSHTIDNQSDPLTGDFFDLSFTSIQSTAGSNGRATFSSSSTRRRTAVIRISINGTISSCFRIGMFRRLSPIRNGDCCFATGRSARWQPFARAFRTPCWEHRMSLPGGGQILNNRPNIVDPNQAILANPVPVAGGEQLLNPAAFAEAAPSTLGNEGPQCISRPGFL